MIYLVLVEIAINSAPIVNTEYSTYYLNYGYHPIFLWDYPDLELMTEQGEWHPVDLYILRMKLAWNEVRKAFENEKQRAAEYSNRKRADYEFRVGQDVLISKRRHYRCKYGDPGCLLYTSPSPRD